MFPKVLFRGSEAAMAKGSLLNLRFYHGCRNFHFSQCLKKLEDFTDHRIFNNQKILYQKSNHWIRFSSESGSNRFDPNRESRRKRLMNLTYISGFIGVCLLSAIGIREYKRHQYRARGLEGLKIRQYGRRPVMYRYRGFVLPDFAVNDIENVHSFEVREDDVWVVSFPKSGESFYILMISLKEHLQSQDEVYFTFFFYSFGRVG